MKKTIFKLTLLTALFFSCGKSTTSKVSNDWKLDTYESIQVDTDSDGQINTISTKIEESIYTRTEIYDGIKNSRNGTVSYFKFYIKKDGTWSRESELIYKMSYNPNTQKRVEKASGTWSFLKKSKGEDFKRNERIIFNTLSQKFFNSEIGQSGNESVAEYTFLTGEKPMIYTIAESSSKKLKLEIETANNVLDDGDLSQSTFKSTMILEPD